MSLYISSCLVVSFMPVRYGIPAYIYLSKFSMQFCVVQLFYAPPAVVGWVDCQLAWGQDVFRLGEQL